MKNRVLARCLRQLMNPQSMKQSTSANNADDVIFQNVDTKRVITLNRPKVLNSLNLSMIHKLSMHLKKYNDDPSVQLVILKGTGEKAFCAGGDVVAVRESGLSDQKVSRRFFYDEYKLNHLIGTYAVPFVAFIDGVTMGGGVGLSVHGMFRVATERTLFAMPETAIGLFPDVGGSYFLPKLRGKLGYFLALTGHRLRGRDIFEAGIATHFVKSDKMKDLEEELLLAKEDTHDMSILHKETIGDILDKYHKESEEPHEFIWANDMGRIKQTFSLETMEEIMTTLEKDGSEWAINQIEHIKKLSPTSLKLTLRQLHEGAKMNFKDVFTMEYRLSQRCVEAQKDFFEGVRAVLVDKCGNPKWDPETLEGVSDELLDWYFSPLPHGRDLVIY